MFIKLRTDDRLNVACVANVSNRVIARKLERKQKKVEGGGEKRKRLPANPTILENALWYFTVRFVYKLTARQNRSITNRLPLDCQTSKISSLIEHVPGDCKNCKKKVYDKRRLKLWAVAAEFLVFLLCGFTSSWNLARNVNNDLSGAIHSVGYKFCRAAALQPVSKRSLEYMPLNFQ